MSIPKDLAIFVYFFVVPFLQTPDWCINYFRERQDTRLVRPVFECTEVDGGTIRYSELPKLSPSITGACDLVCLGILTFYRCYKMSWRKQSAQNKCRSYFLFALTLMSVVDLGLAVLNNRYPYASNYAKPFVILVFLSSIRANIFELVHDFKESIVILGCTFAYVSIYVVIGFYLFRYSNQ